jgi:hypothetical protein
MLLKLAHYKDYMGPYNPKWGQYCYLAKCVGFEPFFKVGPVETKILSFT